MCVKIARQTGQAPASFGATCTETASLKPLHCSQHAGGVSGQKVESTVETGLILFLFSLYPSFINPPPYPKN